MIGNVLCLRNADNSGSGILTFPQQTCNPAVMSACTSKSHIKLVFQRLGIAMSKKRLVVVAAAVFAVLLGGCAGGGYYGGGSSGGSSSHSR